MTDTPIIVHSTPTTPQIEAAIRQFFVAAGPVIGVLAATGWGQKLHLSDVASQILTFAGPIAGLIAFIYGQMATRENATKAAAMAAALPNNIAQTK